jgi:hypothetical protein
MDFFQMLIVLAVAAVVLYGIQIIVTRAFIREADDAIDDGRFNSRMSLNRMLNRKMVHYRRLNPASMRWLVFCSNILLPAMTVSGIWGSVSQSLREGFMPDGTFFLYLAFTGANLLSTILIRGINPPAFCISFLPGISLLACLIFPISSFNWVNIVGLVVFVPLTAANAWYFIRRRELFLLSLSQMEQKAADIQNAA